MPVDDIGPDNQRRLDEQTTRETLEQNNQVLKDISDTLKKLLDNSYEEKKSREERDRREGSGNINVRKAAEASGFSYVTQTVAGSLPDPLKRLATQVNDSALELLQVVFNSYSKKMKEAVKSTTVSASQSNKLMQAVESATGGMGGGIGAGPPAIPGVPEGPAGSGLIGSLMNMGTRFGPYGLIAKEAFKVLNAVNDTQKELRESGAITGQGAGAGFGAVLQGIKMGANPFDLLSMRFATEIVNTFRSAGFKDELAYSLADSFGQITKQIGENLSKQILPTMTGITATIQNQMASVYYKDDKGIKRLDLFEQQKDALTKSFSDITNAIKNLDSFAKNTTASVSGLQDNFVTFFNQIIELGTIEPKNIENFSKFLETLTQTTALGGQYGLTLNPRNVAGLSQAVTGGAGYLAGLSGIPSPLAFLSKNQDKITKGFTDLFTTLAKSKPANVPTETFAAYLLAGFLPAIGMGSLTLSQVVALLGNAPITQGEEDRRTRKGGQARDIGQITSVASRISQALVSTQIIPRGINATSLSPNMKRELGESEAIKAALKGTNISLSDIENYLTSMAEQKGTLPNLANMSSKSGLISYLSTISLQRDLQKGGSQAAAIDVTGDIATAISKGQIPGKLVTGPQGALKIIIEHQYDKNLSRDSLIKAIQDGLKTNIRLGED